MSITTTPAPPQIQRPRSRRQAIGTRQPATARHSAPAAAPTRHGRGGKVLFEVPFNRSMTGPDLARLARAFDLSTHTYAKQRPDPTSPGVARLDHFSGLYLERGPSEGEWVLEARTWGHPGPETVHEWHLLTTQAAHQLDPSVPTPARLPAQPVDVADRPVGEVLNRRFARLRRRTSAIT